MLSNVDILSELKAKQEHLERVVYDFKCTTLDSYVSIQDSIACMQVSSIWSGFLFFTEYPIWDPHLGRRLDLFIVNESYLRIGSKPR